MALLAQENVLGVLHRIAVIAQHRSIDEAHGTRVGHVGPGMVENGVGPCGHCSERTDAESQCQDRGESESRSFPQLTQRNTQIANEIFDPRQTLLIVIIFPDCGHRAKFQRSPAARFSRGHPGSNVIRGLKRDMLLDEAHLAVRHAI